MNLKTVGAILVISFVVAIYMQFTGMGGRTVPHFSTLDVVAFVVFVILLLGLIGFLIYKRNN